MRVRGELPYYQKVKTALPARVVTQKASSSDLTPTSQTIKSPAHLTKHHASSGEYLKRRALNNEATKAYQAIEDEETVSHLKKMLHVSIYA